MGEALCCATVLVTMVIEGPGLGRGFVTMTRLWRFLLERARAQHMQIQITHSMMKKMTTTTMPQVTAIVTPINYNSENIRISQQTNK